MKGASQRGGRPKKPAIPGTRTQIGIRVGADVKGLLDDAMKRSGRTQSQEAELRLEMSFQAEKLFDQLLELQYGRQFAALLQMISKAMDRTGRRCAFNATGAFEAMENWLSNPYAFDQAAQAAQIIVEALRPDGNPAFSGRAGLRSMSSDDYVGVDEACGIVEAVRAPDDVNSGIPENEQNFERELFGRKTNLLLGPVISKRIKAPDLRKLHELAIRRGG